MGGRVVLLGEVFGKPSLIRWHVCEGLRQARVLAVGIPGGRASQAEWNQQGLEKFKLVYLWGEHVADIAGLSVLVESEKG